MTPLLLALACAPDDSGTTGTTTGTSTSTTTATTTAVPATYVFVSALSGEPSVAYDGQVFRQLLIGDLAGYLGNLTERLTLGDYYPVAGDVRADLEFYYAFDDATSAAVPHGRSTSLPADQVTYADVSGGKDLTGKIAGNDATGQHKDWSTELAGWGPVGSYSPEGLVRTWFDAVDAQAAQWAAGNVPIHLEGEPVPAVYVTPEGLDLKQLLEKFLRGAVAFSQGADDYLDDDLDGKGLNSDHLALDGDAPYTPLEHQWDEGFGYFGAPRAWPAWTDEVTAGTAEQDDDGSGTIDLLFEVAWGHSTNAGKRDLGAAELAAADFTAQAWEGFAAGRQLLADTAGNELTADERAQLLAYRDQAVQAWEAGIAATVVHYVNDTLGDMAVAGTPDWSFEDQAKHWGELKGFALSLQFNPRSPLSDADFESLHALIGQAPVLPSAGAAAVDAAMDDLVAARDLVMAAYGFDPALAGGDDGQGGW